MSSCPKQCVLRNRILGAEGYTACLEQIIMLLQWVLLDNYNPLWLLQVVWFPDDRHGKGKKVNFLHKVRFTAAHFRVESSTASLEQIKRLLHWVFLDCLDLEKLLHVCPDPT